MQSNTAIQNISYIGLTILFFGLIGLIGVIVYWNDRELTESILKLLFASILSYFGFKLIHSLRGVSNPNLNH
jgi:hypothetical protein